MDARWFLAALLAAALPASALSLSTDGPETPIPPGQSVDVAVAVTADCLQDILGGSVDGGGSFSTTVTVSEPPSWLTASGGEVSFSITDCTSEPGGTTVTKNATLTLAAAADAPGLQAVDLSVGAEGETATMSGVFVDYLPGHTIAPAGDQTFEVDGDTYAFFVNITVTANAMTMVMFEDQQTVGAATIEGLGLRTFDVAAGETSASLPITFTAASGNWDNVTFAFRNFSHCMQAPEGYACDPQLERNITWTFMNSDGPGGNGGGENGSPGIGFVAVLAIVALAAIRRR